MIPKNFTLSIFIISFKIIHILFSCKIVQFFCGKLFNLLAASYNLINNGIASGIFINLETKEEFKKHLLRYYENEIYKQEIIDYIKFNCIEYVPEFENRWI